MKLNKDGKEKLQQILFRKGLILESLIKKRAPVYRGEYKASWETRKNRDGSVTVATYQGGKGKALEYGGEEGSWPPVDQLRKWVERKLNPEDVDTTTFLIGQHIFENGIEPQPHVRPAIKEFKQKHI